MSRYCLAELISRINFCLSTAAFSSTTFETVQLDKLDKVDHDCLFAYAEINY